MQLTIRPTDRIVVVDDGFPCRVWQGTTDRGTQVHVFIRAFCVPVEQCKDEELAEFQELLLADTEPEVGTASQFGLAESTTFEG